MPRGSGPHELESSHLRFGTIYAPSVDLVFENATNVAFRGCIVGTFTILNGNVTVLT